MYEIECAQLHSELFRRRHSTRQSHGLFALAKRLLKCCCLAKYSVLHHIKGQNIRKKDHKRVGIKFGSSTTASNVAYYTMPERGKVFDIIHRRPRRMTIPMTNEWRNDGVIHLGPMRLVLVSNVQCRLAQQCDLGVHILCNIFHTQ